MAEKFCYCCAREQGATLDCICTKYRCAVCFQCEEHCVCGKAFADESLERTVSKGRMTRELTAEELLASVKVKPNGCWEWIGYRQTQGGNYGQTRSGKKDRYAHRIAYKLFVGPIPKDQLVRHTCNNPPCINPKHLRLGTMVENYQDAVDSGRAPFGEKNGNARYTLAQIQKARALHAQGHKRGFISKETGIKPKEVWAIVTRRRWSHV